MLTDPNVELPWVKINDFLLDCGSRRVPKEFSIQILNKIDGLIPFDQARLYFLDDNCAVYDEYLLGVDKKVAKEYHDYYSKVDNGAFAIAKKAMEFRIHYPSIEECIYDWDSYNHDEIFFKEYIRPHQIRHSFGLAMRDTHNTMKCMFSLDRVSDIEYSKKEIAIESELYELQLRLAEAQQRSESSLLTVETARRTVALAQRAYANGQATYLAVIDAQDKLDQVWLNFANIGYEFLSAIYDWELAVGLQ